MKRISSLAVLFVAFFAMTFTSCDTEPVDPVLTPNPGEEPGGNAPAVFKVDFSGQTYVATSTIATIGQNLITIGGLKGTNGEMVSIVIEGSTTGTYDGTKAFLDYNTGTSEYSYINVNPDGGQDTGSVVITKIDTAKKTISGTFNYVGYWSDDTANLPSIAFTNGTFENIPYNTTGGGNPTDPETGTDVFSAKIDGAFKDYSTEVIVGVSGDEGHQFISLSSLMDDTSLSLSLFSDYTAGTYALGSGFNDPSGDYMDADGNGYSIESGSITVISNANGRIKGTFTGVATNDDGETVYTITDGVFDVEWDF